MPAKKLLYKNPQQAQNEIRDWPAEDFLLFGTSGKNHCYHLIPTILEQSEVDQNKCSVYGLEA